MKAGSATNTQRRITLRSANSLDPPVTGWAPGGGEPR